MRAVVVSVVAVGAVCLTVVAADVFARFTRLVLLTRGRLRGVVGGVAGEVVLDARAEATAGGCCGARACGRSGGSGGRAAGVAAGAGPAVGGVVRVALVLLVAGTDVRALVR